MNRYKTYFWFVIILSLIPIGCTVGPYYKPPEIDMPCEWSSTIPEDMYLDSPDCFNWWESLNDPLLNSLIERASTQNLDLYVAATRILEVRAELKGKEASLYPRVDGSITSGYFKCNENHLIRDVLCSSHCKEKKRKIDTGFFELGFDASWELDFFGLMAHEKNALKAKIEASEESFRDIWISLSAEIGKHYVALRGLQLRLELIQQNIEVQKEVVYLIQELLKIGMADRVNLLQVEEQLNFIASQKPLIELEIDKAIHRLSILLGYSPGDLFAELIEIKCLPTLPVDKPIGVPSELLRRRPDIRKAERELAAATENIGSAVAALFPRLSLRGFIGDITNQLKTLLNPSSAVLFVTPQLILPIFNSKLLLQDVDYSKIKTQQAFYEYQKTVLLALEETENAISAFHHQLDRNYSLLRMQEVHEESYRLTLQLYERGLKNYLEVLGLIRSGLTNQDTYIQNQVELLFDYISIYKALGGGWYDTSCVCETQILDE